MAQETITRVYDSYADAERVLGDLRASGFTDSEASIIGNRGDTDAGEGAAAGAGIGGAIGAGAGLLAGLGMIAIPGIGPVVAAGWLASMAAGAATGAVAGGVVGALTEAGVSEEDAHAYAEGVRRGGSLVSVTTEAGRIERAREILDAGRPYDMVERRSDWRNEGWDRFDPTLPPRQPTILPPV